MIKTLLKYSSISISGLVFVVALTWVLAGREKFHAAWRDSDELFSCAPEFGKQGDRTVKQWLIQLSRIRLQALGKILSQGSAHASEIAMLPYVYLFISDAEANKILRNHESHCSPVK